MENISIFLSFHIYIYIYIYIYILHQSSGSWQPALMHPSMLPVGSFLLTHAHSSAEPIRSPRLVASPASPASPAIACRGRRPSTLARRMYPSLRPSLSERSQQIVAQPPRPPTLPRPPSPPPPPTCYSDAVDPQTRPPPAVHSDEALGTCVIDSF